MSRRGRRSTPVTEFPDAIIILDDILDACVDGRRTLINLTPPSAGDRLVLFAKGGDVYFDGLEVRPIAAGR